MNGPSAIKDLKGIPYRGLRYYKSKMSMIQDGRERRKTWHLKKDPATLARTILMAPAAIFVQQQQLVNYPFHEQLTCGYPHDYGQCIDTHTPDYQPTASFTNSNLSPLLPSQEAQSAFLWHYYDAENGEGGQRAGRGDQSSSCNGYYTTCILWGDDYLKLFCCFRGSCCSIRATTMEMSISPNTVDPPLARTKVMVNDSLTKIIIFSCNNNIKNSIDPRVTTPMVVPQTEGGSSIFILFSSSDNSSSSNNNNNNSNALNVPSRLRLHFLKAAATARRTAAPPSLLPPTELVIAMGSLMVPL
eukprot:jgi/Bigna1/70017/fgenesh1_pg.10_\